jgi:hypothetical protein
VALLAGVGVAVLWLNTSLAEGSFEIQALEGELAALEVNREVINEQLVARGEPGALAARAAGLGMVESAASGYILLREGIIAGSPVAAGTSTDEETGEGPGGQTSTGTSGLGTEGER